MSRKRHEVPREATESIEEVEQQWDEQLRQAEAEIERLRAERDRARELAVWAVRHWGNVLPDRKTVAYNDDHAMDLRKYVDTDGTNAGIYAALEEAMGSE